MTRVCTAALIGGVIVASATFVAGQGAAPAAPVQPAGRQNRPPAPTRDPRTPGYVTATNAVELPDGAVPPVTAYGNFILGPTHPPAPEMTVQPGVPQGTVHNFTISSADSKIYPGIARAAGTRAEVDPKDPAKRLVNSGPAPYRRRVAVYIRSSTFPAPSRRTIDAGEPVHGEGARGEGLQIPGCGRIKKMERPCSRRA